MTPLGERIAALIRRDGPMGVERYMELCLADPEHGYYITRDPLGASGDFTTAPEISQIFGELLGLWAAAVWDRMGRPTAVNLIELGPGRGTLMADALRAARVLPAFREAVAVHLVETSPALRAAQGRALAHEDIAPAWHDSLGDVPDGPAILLANEFFDALPIRQFVRTEHGWHERVVALKEDGALTFAAGERIPAGDLPPALRDSPPGSLFERADIGAGIARDIAARLSGSGGCALVVDYGHAGPLPGETLQAVKNHRYADPLGDPGEADLTAHVDFDALARAARLGGAEVFGLVTQRDLMLRLGAEARAERLRTSARADQVGAIDTGYRRITARGRRSMGEMFKAVAIAAPGLGTPPAFTEPYRPRP